MDPTRIPGAWDTFFALQRRLDADIEQFYAQRGIAGMRSRFALPMVRLAHEGPLTIRDLAASLDRTHSALSQTVAALREAGMVYTVPGSDARTRLVDLTARGRELGPLIEAEWRATEAVVAELDREVSAPLSYIAAELAARVEARPMSERLAAHLAEPE